MADPYGAMYDDIAHSATIYSYRQCAMFSLTGPMESVAGKLKALRNRTVPKLSSRTVAGHLGVPASTYAAYEDPKKFKKPVIPVHLAHELSRIFEPYGVPAHEVMQLAGVSGELMPSPKPAPDIWLPLSGVVAAGVWRQQSAMQPEEQYEVKVGPPPYPGAERFIVRMEGYSMDLVIPPGADLECLRVPYSTIHASPGDIVIVERTDHDLTELTCKRLGRDKAGWYLRAESSRPEFNELIRIGEPDPFSWTDDTITVIGIVLAAHLDLAPQGLSARRRSAPGMYEKIV